MTPLLLALLLQAAPTAAAPAQARPPRAEAAIPDPATPGRGNPDLDVEHYALELRLVPPVPWVSARARLNVRLLAPLRILELDLHESLHVAAARVDGEEAAVRRPPGRLALDLQRRRPAGDRLLLDIRYSGPLPDDPSQGEALGLLSDGVALVSYAEPDGAHHIYPCNDHPSDKATYQWSLSVPWGHFAAAGGRLVAWEPDLLGPRFHWRTDHPLATYLAPVAAGPFTPIQRPGPVPILDLVWARDATRAQRSLARVEDMIPFLERRFGPYPFERYGHVFTDLPVGGLENQTMTVLGRDAGLGGDPALLVHELAHQWFGDHVSPRQWRDLWLNEAWATYAEELWLEHAGHPELLRQTLALWRWSTLHLAEQRWPWTLAEPDPQDLFQVHLVYNKGGMVLHLLDGWLGRERLHAAARTYLERHAGGNAATADFQGALEQAAGEDLEPFFSAWVRGNTVPEVAVRLDALRRRDGWRAVVHLRQAQEGPFHPFAAEVALRGGERERRLPVRFEGRTAELSADLDFEPEQAVLDPDGFLPWLPAR